MRYYLDKIKSMIRIFAFCCIFCFVISSSFAQMNNETMGKILEKEVYEIEGRSGNWQIIYGKRLIYIITDETANRMRIFTPIIEEEKLEEGQLKKMLEANFHAALDAKYSLYEKLVISVYTHPLKELQKDQFIDAMQQVVNLADTFGGSYSSTDVIFNPGSQEEDSDSKEDRTNKKPKGKKKEGGTR